MAYSPGGLGRKQAGRMADKLVIDLFVKYYKVDMKEAQNRTPPATAPLTNSLSVRCVMSTPNRYRSECPGYACRWRYQQLGKIEEDKILQAKGHNYSLKPCWQATI